MWSDITQKIYFISLSSFLLVLLSHENRSGRAEGASVVGGPCSEKCGTLDIPYPFGIKPGCFLPGFQLACNQSTTPPSATIQNTTVQVLSFDVSSAQLRVNSTAFIAHDCVNQRLDGSAIDLLEDGPFVISAAKNKYLAIGCDTISLLFTANITDASDCISLCTASSYVTSGSCTGAGCCQAQIPKKKKALGFVTAPVFKYANVSDHYKKCSYSFMVEDGGYTFKVSDLTNPFQPENLSVVLDWGIGEVGCSNLSGNSTGVCALWGSCRLFGCEQRHRVRLQMPGRVCRQSLRKRRMQRRRRMQ